MACSFVAGRASSACSPLPNKHVIDDDSSICSSPNAKRPRTNDIGIDDGDRDNDSCDGRYSHDEWSAHELSDGNTAILAQLEADLRVGPGLELNDDDDEEAVGAQLEAEMEAYVATLLEEAYNPDDDTKCSGDTGTHQVHEPEAVAPESKERAGSTSLVEVAHNAPALTPFEEDTRKEEGAVQDHNPIEDSGSPRLEPESRNNDVSLDQPKLDSGEESDTNVPHKEAGDSLSLPPAAAEGPSQKDTSQEDTDMELAGLANRTSPKDQTGGLIIGGAEKPALEWIDELVPLETTEVMHDYQDETQPVEFDFGDTASESSQLSSGFYEDFRSDLSVDLHNVLITFEMPSVPVEEPELFFDTRITNGFPKADTRDLRHTLRKWLGTDKASRSTSYFYHKFDHVYHQDNFPVGSLVLRDMALLNTIGPLVDKLPLDIFFAVLDNRDQLADDSGSQGFLVKKLVDLYGHVLGRDIPVGHESFISQTHPPLHEVPPDFFETALIVVPRDSVAEFLMDAAEASHALTSPYCLDAQTVPSIIAYYADRLAEPENRERVRPVFLDVCARAYQMDPAKELAALTPTIAESLFVSLVRAGDWDMFGQLAPHSHGSIPTSVFELARAEVQAGRVAFRDIEQVILISILSLPSTHLQCTAITKFVEPSDDEEAQSWARQAAVQAAETTHSHPLGEDDGRSLIYMARTVLGFEQMATILPPLVVKHASHTSFMLGVVNELGRHVEDLPTPSATHMFERFAKQTITAMEIPKLGNPLRPLGHRTTAHSPQNPVQRSKISPASLVAFVLGLMKHNVSDSLMLLLGFKIVGNADLIARHDFSLFWLPFLRLLLEALETQNIPLSASRYQHIFSAILSAYKSKFVGIRPPKKWLPACQNLTCKCSICEKFNAFLASEENKIEIPVLHNMERSHVLSFICPKVVSLSCDINETPGHMEVTKRFLGPVDPEVAAQWLTRREEAEKEMTQFDMDKLKIIIGDMPADILPPRAAEEAEEPPPKANFHLVEAVPQRLLPTPQPAQQPQFIGSRHQSDPGPRPEATAQHTAASQSQTAQQPRAVQQAQPAHESQPAHPTTPVVPAPLPIDHYRQQVHQIRQQDYHRLSPGFDCGPPPQSWQTFPQHPAISQSSPNSQYHPGFQHLPVSEDSYGPQVPNSMYHTNPQYPAQHQGHSGTQYPTNAQPFTTYQHQHPPQSYSTRGSTPAPHSYAPQQAPSHSVPLNLNDSQGQQLLNVNSKQYVASSAERPEAVNYSPLLIPGHSPSPLPSGRELYLREERIRMRLTLPMTPLNVIDGMLVSKWEHSPLPREEWEVKARIAQYAIQSADRVAYASMSEHITHGRAPPARLSTASDNRTPASPSPQYTSDGPQVTSIHRQTTVISPENYSQPPALSNYPSPRVIARQAHPPQRVERWTAPTPGRLTADPKPVALVGPSLGSRLEQGHTVNSSGNGISNESTVHSQACPLVPASDAGFDEYFAELEPRLRITSPNSPVESIRAVLSKRWKAMSGEHRAVYADTAAEKAKKSAAPSMACPAAATSHGSHDRAKVTGSHNSDRGFRYFLNTLGPAKKAACPSWSYENIIQEHIRLWGHVSESDRQRYQEDAAKLERDPKQAGEFYKALERACKHDLGLQGGSGGGALSKSAPGPSTANTADNLMLDPGFKHYLNQNGPTKKKTSPSWSYEAIYSLFARTWVVLSENTRRFHTEQAAALERRDPDAAARFFRGFETVCPPAKPTPRVDIAEAPRAAAQAARLLDSPSPTHKTFSMPASILDSDDDEPLAWRKLSAFKGPRKRTPSGVDLGTTPKMVKMESIKKEGIKMSVGKTWRGAGSVDDAPLSPSLKVLEPVSSNRVSASRLSAKGGS
ncbi:hypothetical protein B0H67DRAFT_561130 [Lasiosphaeris hirsuta]|uniref:Uncharacterized protein n=1 Tax=Lasiosphaeris hirsuta TaxID=260670 RepID=A0AA40E9Q0_9PEZI|nr:hypothetical protein B0H67DRAFT_561130 [Lasiosphaeris hirsuta]